ncbi:hypothetical protein GFL80_01480 [Rhizobium leguminosarum bv. viciae]|uniref:hypothetical protein n=1 Tax=Rhizobium leguminosarum TaxID=384 RepID=UPI00144244B8|nr:hypothetical protein [Rhizobium leguminosarum]NKK00005.1 hypothetical protein [Rhizobium leguminosarum bv. viciae]NKK82976.1 hypothetical protein [Rhizobium leguminosarum bv. viciae]
MPEPSDLYWPISRGAYNFRSLRSVPTTMEISRRLLLEAIGYAGDAIHLSMGRLYDKIFEVHLRASEISFEPSHEEHVAIFVDAWSVIDQANALRGLLQKLEGSPTDFDTVKAFLAGSEPARKLRNYMDHMNSYLGEKGDLSTRTSGPPLFGALTFTWVHPNVQEKPGYLGRHRMWYLPASGHHVDTRLNALPHSVSPRFAPIDRVFLRASKYSCNLTDLADFALRAVQSIAVYQRGITDALVADAIARNQQLKAASAKSEYSCEIIYPRELAVAFHKTDGEKITEVSDHLDPREWQVVSYQK